MGKERRSIDSPSPRPSPTGEGETQQPVRTGVLGLLGFAGFEGADDPQPVDTEVRPPVFFVFSSSFFVRSERPVVLFDFPPVLGLGFQPPVDEVPQPVETEGRLDGLLGFVEIDDAPQPVAVGRRPPAFPTVMTASLFPTARSDTSCRGR